MSRLHQQFRWGGMQTRATILNSCENLKIGQTERTEMLRVRGIVIIDRAVDFVTF